MNDRELLAMAAKAGGIPGLKYRVGPCIPAAWIYDYVDASTYKTWNPLTNDGNALRLAVRLRLDISFLGAIVEVCWFDEGASAARYVEERINDAQGECEATRRAIVRAAAEIGATQPSKDGGGDE